MIKKFDKLVICLIIFGLFSLFVPVVSAGTENIDFGVIKTASIDVVGEVDSYTFAGNANDGIDIRITKTHGDLWPRITLYGPSGKEITRSSGSIRTEISYVLTAPGTYKILVDDGFQGKYTGEYSLFIQKVTNPKNSQSVEFGNSVPGSINAPGSITTYSFPGGAGGEVVIRITKNNGNLWPRITLFGPSGKQLKQSSGSITAELSSPLVSSGIHTILVDDGFQGTYYGEYTIFTQITAGTQSSGTQSTTITNGIPVSSIVTTITTPIVKPSPGTQDGPNGTTYGGEFLVNYLILIIIAIIVIGAIVIAYNKFIRKPKSAGTTGYGIQVPLSHEGGVSGTVNHDIIISHSSQDKPIADAVCAGLEARKIRCWIAPRDILPGVNYQESIIDAIDSSKIMVLIFSSHSNNSPHVLTEVNEAMSKGVIIIPFRIEDILPSKAMKYLISGPHWLDAMTPPLEKHIDELGNTILILLDNERKKRKTE